MKYFTTFWILTISRASEILRMLENLDTDDVVLMRELDHYYFCEKNQNHEKSVKEISTLVVPPRRRNNRPTT